MYYRIDFIEEKKNLNKNVYLFISYIYTQDIKKLLCPIQNRFLKRLGV